jgi:hypothetical protein
VTPAVSLLENIYQVAFQDPDVPAVLENTSRVLRTVSDLTTFVNSQISQVAQADADEKAILEENIDANKTETVSIYYAYY